MSEQSTKLHLAEVHPQVSLLIPVYNEGESVLFLFHKIKKALAELSYEWVIVDDGSTDDSAEKIRHFIKMNPELSIHFYQQKNQGKGAAIRTAIEHAHGDILVVQDADLEYDPTDILRLIEPFREGAMVVYGSRILHPENKEHSSPFFYWGGRLITWATNLLFRSQLTDEPTGYKLFSRHLFENLGFIENDFSWEPEITAKILKKRIAIVEKPIRYTPRSKAEGKKISYRDGLKALRVLWREFLKK